MATVNNPRGIVATLVVVLIAIAAFVVGAFWRQSTPRPTVALDAPIYEIGVHPSFDLHVAAEKGRIARLTVTLFQGDVEAIVQEKDLRPDGVTEAKVRVDFDTASHGLVEGEALLEVQAEDDYWRPRSSGDAPSLRIPVRIDLTPPVLQVTGATRYPVAGGAAVAGLRTEDAEAAWILVDERRFDGYSVGNGEFVAFYALDIDHDAEVLPLAVAIDAAGNERRVELPVYPRATERQIGEVNLSLDWLRRKLPDLLPGRTAIADGELADAFREVSGPQREAAATVRSELSRTSGASVLWEGAFLQLPNSRTMSRFGATRTYMLDGQALDTRMHAGFDLASVKQAPIPAANSGVVVHAGPLTLYGEAVILDHGMGVMSLYGHCSSVDVQVGQAVRRGQTIAHTGATGLAAGDHLHFEVVVGGVPVTPIQWWDPAWIRDHIEAPLSEASMGWRESR